MDSQTLIVLLGLLVIGAIVWLLARQQRMGGVGEATFRLADLLEASIKLGPEERAAADEAVTAATEQKVGERTSKKAGSVDIPSVGRLARVLWVDDNPDNNVYETIAFERLGRLVTKTTSTEAALTYLSEMTFSVVISDLGRGQDPRAGFDFISKARRAGHDVPVIIYTLNAERHREEGEAVGAVAVVDMPDKLLNATQSALRQDRHGESFGT